MNYNSSIQTVITTLKFNHYAHEHDLLRGDGGDDAHEYQLPQVPREKTLWNIFQVN